MLEEFFEIVILVIVEQTSRDEEWSKSIADKNSSSLVNRVSQPPKRPALQPLTVFIIIFIVTFIEIIIWFQ